MKLVVISSYGPMAASSLAALLEKFGFLNLPFRKIGLSEYIMGEREINAPYEKKAITNYIKS